MNLRPATSAQNHYNNPRFSNKDSGYPEGISLVNGWLRAQITPDGQQIQEYFKNTAKGLKQAIDWRTAAEIEHYGEFRYNPFRLCPGFLGFCTFCHQRFLNLLKSNDRDALIERISQASGLTDAFEGERLLQVMKIDACHKSEHKAAAAAAAAAEREKSIRELYVYGYSASEIAQMPGLPMGKTYTVLSCYRKRGIRQTGIRRRIRRSDGVEFNTQIEAAEKTGCDNADISKVCRGKAKTAGGYGWTFC